MNATPERLDLADAEVWLHKGVFPPSLAADHFDDLRRQLDWQEATITLFGKPVKSPRLSAWYGDVPYCYSGLTWPACPWPAILEPIRDKAETLAGTSFNGVLANLYRDGRDSMGWHADDEPELGPDPVIASVVFGADRRFVMRHKLDKSRKIEVPLGNGDLLVMGTGVQIHWMHAVPKTAKTVGARINLTFRHLQV